jgi:Na+/H+-translocating membrane pyrophosphatase
MNSIMIYLPIVMAIIGLLFMGWKRSWVLKQDAGDGKMKEISDYIYEGALIFKWISIISDFRGYCERRFSWISNRSVQITL